jgi:hypothetical protein
MKPFKVKVEVGITTIDDVLITALEGGSNYWYYLLKKDLPAPAGWQRNPTFHYEFLDKVYSGASLPVHDAENPKDKLGELNCKSIQRALILMAQDYPEILTSILDENYDAGDADVFFQLCIMGEVVFG